MLLLPQHSYLERPWKNGGGVTREIAVSPAGSSLDEFDWRVSTADVRTSGPFSVFPAVDRTLLVVSGAGMVLEFGAATQPQILTASSDALSFSGDDAPFARLLGGAITDLNVMTRRARARHTLKRCEWLNPAQLQPVRHPGVCVVFVLSGSLHARQATHAAEPFDTLVFEPNESIAFSSTLPCCVAEIVIETVLTMT